MAFFFKKNSIEIIDNYDLLISFLKNTDLRTADCNEIDRVYSLLSKLFFNEVHNIQNNNLSNILTFIQNEVLDIGRLTDQNGYNIIVYCLFNNENELFKNLYTNCYKFLESLFDNVPLLFTIILKKRNWNLILFFLTTNNLSENLKKSNITECFFEAIRNDQNETKDFIISNFPAFLDSNNLNASIIYFISHNSKKELSFILNEQKLIQNYSDKDLETLIGIALINDNAIALQLMLNNPLFVNSIKNSKSDIKQTLFNYISGNKNVFLLQSLLRIANDK